MDNQKTNILVRVAQMASLSPAEKRFLSQVTAKMRADVDSKNPERIKASDNAQRVLSDYVRYAGKENLPPDIRRRTKRLQILLKQYLG